MPSVEDIQDVVESVLIENRLTRIAKNYIIYRHQHAMARAAKAHAFEVTDNVPVQEALRGAALEHGSRMRIGRGAQQDHRTGKFPELVQGMRSSATTRR